MCKKDYIFYVPLLLPQGYPQRVSSHPIGMAYVADTGIEAHNRYLLY
jgi:hypothetical protein